MGDAFDYEIMVGIGCGRNEHHESFPIDTVNYIANADAIRARADISKGALVLADIDVPEDKALQRKERLKQILKVLKREENWDLMAQTDLPREKAKEVTVSDSVPPRSRDYYRNEITDAALLLAENGIKVGWVVDKKNNKGGEAAFDREILANFPGRHLRFIYTDAGVSLRKKGGIEVKCPYLTKLDEIDNRLCIVNGDVEQEVEKLKQGATEKAIAATRNFCAHTLGRPLESIPPQGLEVNLREALKIFAL